MAGRWLSRRLRTPKLLEKFVGFRLITPCSRCHKEQIILLVTADQPDAPAYFTYDAILNTRERATLDRNLEQALHPIDLDEVLRMGDAGAQILDVRDPAGTPRATWPAASISDWAGNTPLGPVQYSIAPSPS